MVAANKAPCVRSLVDSSILVGIWQAGIDWQAHPSVSQGPRLALPI